jgi:(1->4)-alpha-D-glucan 1-alpha-D-glucosylmutase
MAHRPPAGGRTGAPPPRGELLTAAPQGGAAGPLGTVPIGSYRIQLRGGVDFDAVSRVLPYLAQLGVSHVYLSPFLTASGGSLHGYDQSDPTKVDQALGGTRGYLRMRRRLRALGLELLVDLVPNHMAIGDGSNAWWQDVLARGLRSRRARFFDIVWESHEPRLAGRVLLPFLPRAYGRMLAGGDLRLVRVGRAVAVQVGVNRYPVAAATLLVSLKEIADAVPAARRVVEAVARDPRGGTIRRRVGAQGQARWSAWLNSDPMAAKQVDAVLSAINRNPSWLDGLLCRQPYRLARWQASNEDLNYRRFFDVDSLVGLRMEDEGVYQAHHGYLLRLLGPGVALRVDHPDGLRDPELYLQRLRAESERRWVVVEKILALGEELPPGWPVEGTTGYDFARLANGLFVDPDAEAALTSSYGEFTGESRPFAEVAHQSKAEVVRALFGSDLNRLTAQLLRIVEGEPLHRDCSRQQVREVLAEMASALAVYRTYLREGGSAAATERAGAPLRAAIDRVAAARPDLDLDLIQFTGQVLSLKVEAPEAHDLAMRFQQLTGAVMAKGVEDTAFYRYQRLISLNEVGDDPGHFGVDLAEFHGAMQLRQARHPLTLNATSTHDSKRSEDVRCRINAISEVPAEWRRAVRRWSLLTARHREGPDLPDRNFEYFLYQTLVGAWPISLDRLWTVVEKSVREAKVHTSWRSPRAGYEASVRAFVSGAIQDPAFIRSLEAFIRRIDRFAQAASLGVTLLKLTAPGVPDVYQGTEVWDRSLVDPDNRRAVDFDRLHQQLVQLESATLPEVLRSWPSGVPKQWLLARGLGVRREFPSAFGPDGSYLPLEAGGARARHVVAFERGGQVVTVVTRLPIGASRGLEDTVLELGDRTWTDRLSGSCFKGGEILVADLLQHLPVALLVAEEAA